MTYQKCNTNSHDNSSFFRFFSSYSTNFTSLNNYTFQSIYDVLSFGDDSIRSLEMHGQKKNFILTIITLILCPLQVRIFSVLHGKLAKIVCKFFMETVTLGHYFKVSQNCFHLPTNFNLLFIMPVFTIILLRRTQYSYLVSLWRVVNYSKMNYKKFIWPHAPKIIGPTSQKCVPIAAWCNLSQRDSNLAHTFSNS